MPFASETVIISEAFPEPDARHVPSPSPRSVSFGERGIFIGSGGRTWEARPCCASACYVGVCSPVFNENVHGTRADLRLRRRFSRMVIYLRIRIRQRYASFVGMTFVAIDLRLLGTVISSRLAPGPPIIYFIFTTLLSKKRKGERKKKKKKKRRERKKNIKHNN